MDLLATIASGWGLPLTPEQLDKFAAYADELLRWNARLNLTAITDRDEIATRHFADSLRLALSWGAAPRSLADVGAGAGLPGLALKILRPGLRLTLIESVVKKADFVRHVAGLLGLDGVTVLAARAEAVGRDGAHREAYDVVTGRAVAELRVLAEYCLPLCRVGGRFLAPKGAGAAAEVAEAEGALAMLGGELLAVEPVLIPGLPARTLVVVEKRAPTPERYPRAVGVPARRPL